MGFMGIEDIGNEDFKTLDVLFKKFIPAHEEIFLFGNGIVAKGYFYFLQECGVNVVSCIQTAPPQKDTVSHGAAERTLIHKEKDKEKREFSEVPTISLKDFRKIYRHGTGKGVLLTVKEQFYDEILPHLYFLGRDLFFVGKSKYIVLNHVNEIQTCSFQIVDHCNLACYGCNVAAPVAKACYMDIREFSRDIGLLHKATGNRIKRVGITGGEALLHPQCKDFLQIARETFSDSQVELLTNGILLAKQEDLFWDFLNSYQITIRMTKYPIAYPNFDRVLRMIQKYKINAEISSMEGIKDSAYLPLHENAVSATYDYALCPLYNFPRVIKGRLFPCCLMPEVSHLNIRFRTNVVISETDSLELESVTSYEDIEQFLHKRSSLCSYCDLRSRKVLDGWRFSQRQKGEWFSEK